VDGPTIHAAEKGEATLKRDALDLYGLIFDRKQKPLIAAIASETLRLRFRGIQQNRHLFSA
jgi:hypothetical protein